ncbi:MAG TPA: contractile injection system protein, VgrG/Pvc8 family, partial [Acetobacteraceae bacterium]|nr:contractile injection system protein, VgrG/Pvc8 family [Acetobacteraceae bacterium]
MRIDTVLGQDHLALVSLRGQDRMSACFSYDLELASTDGSVKPDDLLGTGATIWLDDADAVRMPMNGIIVRFAVAQRSARGLTVYRVRLVPALWLLTRTSDCRIF